MAATRNSHPGVVYKFTPKNRWDVKLHFFSGITAWPWVKFLVRHVTHIDWAVYWHRVLFLSIMAVINTLLAVPDWIMYRKRVDSQALHPEPVIILGHPRTGTTHLHNILSLDPAFAFCNTFHAGFPSSFVFLAPYRDLLSPMLAPTRPMDNMALHWDLPAEDEIATTVLSGGTSPYTSILLPREAARSFRDFFTFGRGSGGGGSSRGKRGGGGGGRVGGGSVPVPAPATASGAAALAARFDEWRGCLLWFLRKVTLAAALSDPSAASPKPLLIKSPVHTARVRLLRAEFPKARFLYIHRHPLHVFQSAAHMADAYYGYTYLQQPTDAAVTEYILNQYDVLYNEYISARGDVPKDRLHELSFDQLEDDPLSTLRAIYAKFGWLERFESLLPKFKAYCATLGDFKCPFADSVKVAFTEDDSHSGDPRSALLLRRVGGGDVIRFMCTLFYTHAFADFTLAPFMFEEHDAVAHGKRLGDWTVQKLGGEGSPWSDSGREGMRSTAHVLAWDSPHRPKEDRGRRFTLSDCRVWMRLHFLACREAGLADHAEFFDFYVDVIQHFVGVYERSASPYAQESAAWSADPANVQRYRDDGCKMVDVLGDAGAMAVP